MAHDETGNAQTIGGRKTKTKVASASATRVIIPIIESTSENSKLAAGKMVGRSVASASRD